jgi:hypothetical protein
MEEQTGTTRSAGAEALEVQLSASEAGREELRDSATLLFEQTASQISLADTKAQLTLAADAILVAAISPLGKGIFGRVTDASLPVLTRASAACTIGTFAALLISFAFALVAVRPRLRTRSHQPSMMYFRQIIRQPEQDFVDRFLHQTPEQVHRALLGEVYAQSVIATRKFVQVRWSVIFLLLALVLWAGAQGLLAIA